MMRKLVKNKALAVCLMAAFAAATAMSATWTGSAGTTSWNNSNNWNPVGVPIVSTSAIIGGDAIVNFDMSGNFERREVTSLSNNARLTIAGKRILHGNNGAATFTISDNALLTHSGDYFIVGQHAAGTINQTGGTVNAAINRGFFFSDNLTAAGSAYYLTGGFLNVRFVAQGDGWFNEFLGRKQARGLFHINGGHASFTVNDGLTRYVDIVSGGNSVFQIDSGSATFTGFTYFTLGHRGDNGSGDGKDEAKVVLNGGSLNIATRPTGSMVVGGPGGRGRLEVNGGTLTVSSPIGLWVGNELAGVVRQTGGKVIIEGNIELGRHANANGSYYLLDGGELRANNILLHANAGATVKFVFNSGRITLNGDRTALLNAAWFKTLPGVVAEYDAANNITRIYRFPYAHDPSPEVGMVDAGVLSGDKVAVTLSWKTGLDLNNPGQPNPAITKHSLYMTNGTTDPNLALIDEISAGNPVAATAAYGPMMLDLDARYYWRVDLSAAGVGPTEPNDPNSLAGRIWYFDTPKSVPAIVEHPAGQTANPGQTVQFAVNVVSVTQASYTWYKSVNNLVTPDVDTVVAAGSNVLTIVNVQGSHEGYYYCKVVNKGGVVYSRVASLGILRKVAHWTLDSADYVAGKYRDISGGGRHADPNGTPLFVDGIVDGDKNTGTVAANGAVTITEGTGWASAGSFNPSDHTGAFTVSAWVHRTGETLTNSMIVCKRSAWAAGQTSWIFMVNNSGQLRLQSWGLGTINAPVGVVTQNNWHHVAVAFNGSSAVLYIDGVRAASGSYTLGDGLDSTFWIGRNESINERFDGYLDDIRIFNYALTDETVVDIFHAETGQYICLYEQANDLNKDCAVNLFDFAIIAENWLKNGFYPSRN